MPLNDRARGFTPCVAVAIRTHERDVNVHRNYLTTISAVCALLVGSFGSLSHAHASSRYKIQLDCHGPNGVPSWSHTGSTMYLEFYVDGRWIYAQPNGVDAQGFGAIPASLCDSDLELGGNLGSYMSSGMIQKIRMRTDGDDAFWLDYMKLTDLVSGQTWQWGVNGGAGYCLSTDPNDAESACWNSAAYSSIEFTF